MTAQMHALNIVLAIAASGLLIFLTPNAWWKPTAHLKWLAFAFGFVAGAATALATSADGHAGCRGECFESCVDIYRECLERCNKLPEKDGQAKECRDRCMGDDEYRECEEHCNADHHDPSC